MKLFKCLWIMESIFNYLKKEGAAWSSPCQVDSHKKSIMPRPFPDILSGKGREVFLGTFLYYRIECILELFDKPFHMFLGALNTTSLFLNVRRMIQYMHYQNSFHV